MRGGRPPWEEGEMCVTPATGPLRTPEMSCQEPIYAGPVRGRCWAHFDSQVSERISYLTPQRSVLCGFGQF